MSHTQLLLTIFSGRQSGLAHGLPGGRTKVRCAGAKIQSVWCATIGSWRSEFSATILPGSGGCQAVCQLSWEPLRRELLSAMQIHETRTSVMAHHDLGAKHNFEWTREFLAQRSRTARWLCLHQEDDIGRIFAAS